MRDWSYLPYPDCPRRVWRSAKRGGRFLTRDVSSHGPLGRDSSVLRGPCLCSSLRIPRNAWPPMRQSMRSRMPDVPSPFRRSRKATSSWMPTMSMRRNLRRRRIGCARPPMRPRRQRTWLTSLFWKAGSPIVRTSPTACDSVPRRLRALAKTRTPTTPRQSPGTSECRFSVRGITIRRDLPPSSQAPLASRR